MKKRVLIFLPIVIVLLFVVGILIGKQYMGTRIRHYKQYMFPCQGQVPVWGKGHEDLTSRIRFYLLDEEEFSEMAELSNIRRIYITTETGEELETKDWTLTRLNSGSELYIKRCLEVSLPFVTGEYVIRELTIVYPDTEETFEVGDLKIIPLEDTLYYLGMGDIVMENTCTDLTSTIPQETPSLLLLNEAEKHLYPMDSTMLRVEGCMYGDLKSMTIQKIDFGIPGFGIDPESIRLEQNAEQNYYFGHFDEYAFAEDPENALYMGKERVREIPEQLLDITVTEQSFQIIASTVKTEAYDSYMKNLYLNPVFYCRDNTRETDFIYGDCSSSQLVYTPYLSYLEADSVLSLIREKGK